MQLWTLLEHAAEHFGPRPAVLAAGQRFTWTETWKRCIALARGLSSEGTKPGDRILVQLENGPAFFELTFAAAGIGAVLVPASPQLNPHELAALIERAQPALHFRSDAQVEETQRPGASADWQPLHSDETQLAQLYFTSGTTGEPKGVMLTHGNLVEHALAAIDEFRLGAQDVWGHIAPMFHLADAWAIIAITAAGGCHAFLPRFDGSAALDLIEQAKVTITNLVPTHLGRMLAARAPQSGPLPSMRLVLSGGAPIAPRTVRDILANLCPEYAQTYGMTETSPFLTLSLLRPEHRQLPLATQLDIRCATGRPYQGIELQVVDSAGDPVPSDRQSVGEIRVRGKSVSPGYWNNPKATGENHRGGWLYTGDLATVDAEGYVRIVDRAKDMILSGGENVYSIEVEKVLHEHPTVLEAAAYGVPSEEWGEEVRAAVVLREASPTPEDIEQVLRRFVAKHLSAFKVPKRILIRTSLPKTPSGKIRKADLRA